MLLLRQLWQVPRIREHYRRLPTMPSSHGVVDSGVLQFGSFFFRRSDMLGAGGTARVYKGMYAGARARARPRAHPSPPPPCPSHALPMPLLL